MIKAVIPAGGLGTRLLPATKQQPKEMLPIFAKDDCGNICVKPVIQVVYETLYRYGIRNFCFVTGKGKRTIEDHFTPDTAFLHFLRQKNSLHINAMESFYKMLENASVMWINQPEPKGFGDAVLRTKNFAENDDVLVHAGDDMIISKTNIIKRLYDAHKQHKADASFIVQEVDEPQKYGVISGEELDNEIYNVSKIVEKPQEPETNIAVVGVYIFNNKIYEYLSKTLPDKNGELQLTDAIEKLIETGGKVIGVKLKADERRIDIGTAEAYRDVLTNFTA